MTVQKVYAEISHDEFHFVLEDCFFRIDQLLNDQGLNAYCVAIDNWNDVWDLAELADDDLSKEEFVIERLREYRRILQSLPCGFATACCYIYGSADSEKSLEELIQRIVPFAECKFEPIVGKVYQARVEYTLVTTPGVVGIIQKAAAEAEMEFELIDYKILSDEDVGRLDGCVDWLAQGPSSADVDRNSPIATITCYLQGRARSEWELEALLCQLVGCYAIKYCLV